MKRKLTSRIRRRLGLPISFGDLDRTEPISRMFGYERGTPVDRYYIDQFLSAHAVRIKGDTLEIGDDSYTARFGAGRTTSRGVLHVDMDHPTATYRGDLAQTGLLPEAAFDCAVVTQTLHLIYDMRAAIANLYSALKPGGTLLLTVPGISQIASDVWGENWFWSLTRASLQRLLVESFGASNVEIGCFGNVLSSTALLYGVSFEELTIPKLDVLDPLYPVIVTGVALKVPMPQNPNR